MNHFIRLRLSAALLLLLLAIPACDNPSAPATLEGAWLGEGVFRTRAGNADVEAQLELLDDNTYRLLILKPSVLALTGPEAGTWSRSGSSLTLTPDAPPEPELDKEGKPVGGVFGALRAGGGQRPPSTLTIANNLATLTLDDGKLKLTFKPNR